jgi:hypothetical protein
MSSRAWSYGAEVAPEDGATHIVDGDYLRRPILDPQAELVLGYSPIMPEFAYRLTEGDLEARIEQLRSLTASRRDLLELSANRPALNGPRNAVAPPP